MFKIVLLDCRSNIFFYFVFLNYVFLEVFLEVLLEVFLEFRMLLINYFFIMIFVSFLEI